MVETWRIAAIQARELRYSAGVDIKRGHHTDWVTNNLKRRIREESESVTLSVIKHIFTISNLFDLKKSPGELHDWSDWVMTVIIFFSEPRDCTIK